MAEITSLTNKRVILYNSSNVSPANDGFYYFRFWARGYLINIISEKPFSRGDTAVITKADYNQDSTSIYVSVMEDEFDENDPVLTFGVSRLVYNSFSDFEFKAIGNVELAKPICIITADDNMSLAFILLSKKGTGKINAKEPKFGTEFDILVSRE